MYRVVVYKGAADKTGEVLHEPRPFGNKVISGDIDLPFNAVSTAEFKVPLQNTLYRQIEPITSLVKVFDTVSGETVFDGRVAKVSGEFSSTHTQTIECEDCLAFLHDSSQTYRKVQNTTIAQFFMTLINYHNSQVDPYKQFKVGRVTVANSTDNVYRYTDDAADTFDTIKDKLVDRLGGYVVWHRESSGQLVIEYLAEYGEDVDTPIMLGKNLKSAKRDFDATELITRLVPIGSVIEQSAGVVDTSADAAQPKTTIEGVNGGVRYLEDKSLVDRFGIIQKPVEWQDVTQPSILKAKGQEYLNQQRIGLLSWTVSVIDISALDPAYQSFKLGNTYPIVDPYLNATERLQVTDQKLNVVRPHTMTLQIGTQNQTLSQFQLEYQAAMTFVKEQRALTSQSLADMKSQLSTLNAIKDKLPEQQSQIDDLVRRINELEGNSGYYEGSIIDVSYYQKDIDWVAVQKAKLALAIVRVQDGSSFEDPKHVTYLTDINNLGINYAVYAFFRATSTADAATEATDFFNRTQQTAINGKQPRFYAIDVEAKTMSDMRSGVAAYMDQLNKLGVPDSRIVIYVGQYTQADWKLNTARAGALWVPAYGTDDGTVQVSHRPPLGQDLWQYTSKGTIAGITGDVDMSTEPSAKFKSDFLSK